MGEVIGDVVMPVEFVLPAKANANLPATPQEGTVFYDATNSKLVFWNGSAYETVTSA